MEAFNFKKSQCNRHPFNRSYPLHTQNNYTLVGNDKNNTNISPHLPLHFLPQHPPQLFNVLEQKTQHQCHSNKQYQKQCSNQEPFIPPLVAFCTVGELRDNGCPLGFLVMTKGK
jgi:hypothetical protein